MKKIITIITLGLMIMACGKQESIKKIGITQIVEHPALDGARNGFLKALEDAGFVTEIVEENRSTRLSNKIIGQK